MNEKPKLKRLVNSSHSTLYLLVIRKSLVIVPTQFPVFTTMLAEEVGEIEEEVSLDRRPFVDRYYLKKYVLSPTPDGGDYMILAHSNRLCLLSLAPSHPIIKFNLTVKSVSFRVKLI